MANITHNFLKYVNYMLSSFGKISIKVHFPLSLWYCLFLASFKKKIMGCNLTLPLSPLCFSLSSLPGLSGTLLCCRRHSENMHIDVFVERFACLIVHDGFFQRGWHRMVGHRECEGSSSAVGDVKCPPS